MIYMYIYNYVQSLFWNFESLVLRNINIFIWLLFPKICIKWYLNFYTNISSKWSLRFLCELLLSSLDYIPLWKYMVKLFIWVHEQLDLFASSFGVGGYFLLNFDFWLCEKISMVQSLYAHNSIHRILTCIIGSLAVSPNSTFNG